MNKNRTKRTTKKDIYAAHGIEYITKGGYIRVPCFGLVKPLLKKGNSKIGRVWQLSIAPRETVFSFVHNGKEYHVCGTCAQTCRDKDGNIACYACVGRYVMQNVKASIGINTWLARYAIDFLKRAIMAQIEADKITVCRVHVSGDFFSAEYIDMWRDIAIANPDTIFWTYTKNSFAESAFNGISNFHVAKSIIKGKGYNFGHCDYILALYDYLTAQGKSVYICKCGFDDGTHCDTCAACRTYDYVLFLEHGTDYDGKADPLYPTLYALVMSQKEIDEAA